MAAFAAIRPTGTASVICHPPTTRPLRPAAPAPAPRRAPVTASVLRQVPPALRGGRRVSRRANGAAAVRAVLRAEKVGDNYVLSTPGRRALGIVHFLGGAFVGAAPQLSYGLLIQLLAEKGYTVITTPYKLTFNHSECAAAVHQTFNDTVDELRETGREQEVPLTGRVFGVGHSNGALLHALIGSMYRVPNVANVLISYNNKQVGDAIPIPGVLEALRPVATQLQQQMEGSAGSVSEAMPLPLCGGEAPWVDKYTADSLDPVLQQVCTVLQEVGEGVEDFTPTPAESRTRVRESYCVPSTLLVKFDDDSIDESEEIAAILCAKYPAGTRLLRLNGTHATPLGQDFDVQQARGFAPAYVAAVASKAVAQFDQRRLSSRVLSWMGR